MVLEIKLNNFFSINEEVILDLRAGNIKTQKSKSLQNNVFEYKENQVLKSVALYGANASGKSNILKTIMFCNAMVFESHQNNENSVFNFKKFKFNGYKNKPSSYFIRFVIDEIEYCYSFSLNLKEILTESLYYYPKGKKAKIFVRNESAGKTKREKYSFGASIIKRPFDVAESTSNKTLFISRASQMDRELAKKIFNYFNRDFILRHSNHSIKNIDKLIESNKKLLLKALQLADSDIIDFKQTLQKKKGKNIKANIQTEEFSVEETEIESLEIKTYHRYSPGVSFDFITEESDGTKQLFILMLTILDVVRNNKTLLIDEIEKSLHPKIVEYIIEIFNASNKEQLIFTTHNTNLLDLNKFRKDQIWFVNKKTDGGSDLYSLYDYSDFRDTMDLEKAYLQGRFDSIPIIDDSKEKLHSIINE
jgi:AAA15 family ATPase/GTPase